MRAVLQRVIRASVTVGGKTVASSGPGLLVFAGLHENDCRSDIEYISSKIIDARIFEDSNGVMNLSLKDTGGGLIAVSQFTLYGDARKGRRPSYSSAMPPDKASVFFEDFLKSLREKYPAAQTGVFGADMKVELINSGPVTILLDSAKLF